MLYWTFVYLCIESFTLQPVVTQQFVWWQNLFLVLRELTLIEVAVYVEELLGGTTLSRMFKTLVQSYKKYMISAMVVREKLWYMKK